MKFFRKIISFFKISAAIVLLAVLAINIHINLLSRKYIYQNIQDMPKTEAILVLGASVYADGRLSDMLKDRADTAIEFYQAKKSDKILASGDHGELKYDETNAMKKYLLLKDIPPKDVFLDYAGFDTYDSVYRAKEIYQIKTLAVATQNFHLPRAIYIGKALGLEVYGLGSDTHKYGGIEYNYLREVLANVKAFWDINIGIKPAFLGKAIPISGDGRESWD